MRLIDADAFLERMSDTDRFFGMVYDINDAPTVDAVAVVRCRDFFRFAASFASCSAICARACMGVGLLMRLISCSCITPLCRAGLWILSFGLSR